VASAEFRLSFGKMPRAEARGASLKHAIPLRLLVFTAIAAITERKNSVLKPVLY
jgi:hypothetical protein